MKRAARSIHGALKGKCQLWQPSCSPASQRRVLEVHFCCVAAMLAVVELCWSCDDLCQNKALPACVFIVSGRPVGVFLGARDAY